MTDIHGVHVEDVEPPRSRPGITRRPLPATERAGCWLIDFAPDTEWPAVDHHEGEARYFLISGAVIEGDRRYGAALRTLAQ